jgi:hypothetical protein
VELERCWAAPALPLGWLAKARWLALPACCMAAVLRKKHAPEDAGRYQRAGIAMITETATRSELMVRRSSGGVNWDTDSSPLLASLLKLQGPS